MHTGRREALKDGLHRSRGSRGTQDGGSSLAGVDAIWPTPAPYWFRALSPHHKGMKTGSLWPHDVPWQSRGVNPVCSGARARAIFLCHTSWFYVSLFLCCIFILLKASPSDSYTVHFGYSRWDGYQLGPLSRCRNEGTEGEAMGVTFSDGGRAKAGARTFDSHTP